MEGYLNSSPSLLCQKPLAQQRCLLRNPNCRDASRAMSLEKSSWTHKLQDTLILESSPENSRKEGRLTSSPYPPWRKPPIVLAFSSPSMHQLQETLIVVDVSREFKLFKVYFYFQLLLLKRKESLDPQTNKIRKTLSPSI